MKDESNLNNEFEDDIGQNIEPDLKQEGNTSESEKEPQEKSKPWESESGRVIDENRPVSRRKTAQDDFDEDEELDDAYKEGTTDGGHDQDDQDIGRETKVRKPREHRLWVRILRKTIITVAILIVLAIVFIFGFRLRTVNVTGNYAYTDEQVLAFFDYEHAPKNTLLFWWNNRNGLAESVPFIEDLSVSIASPSTINITVTEKLLVGCFDDNGVYMFFDSSGVIVETSTTRPEDVALITGVGTPGLQIGDTLDVGDSTVLGILHELSVLLRNYEIGMDQIDCSNMQSIVMHKGSIRILLGTGLDLDEKINAYKDLEPNLEGLSGQLHLENYDSTKKSIFFSKD